MTVPEPKPFSLRALGLRVIRAPGARSDGQGRALRVRRFLAEIPGEHRNAAMAELAAFYLDALERRDRDDRERERLRDLATQAPSPRAAQPQEGAAPTSQPARPGGEQEQWRVPLTVVPGAGAGPAAPSARPAGDAPAPAAPVPLHPVPPAAPEPRCEHTGLLERACGHCHPPAEPEREASLSVVAQKVWVEEGGCSRTRLASEIARRTGRDMDAALRAFCASFVTSRHATLVPASEQRSPKTRNMVSWKVRGLSAKWPELATNQVVTRTGERGIGKCTPDEVEWSGQQKIKMGSDLTAKGERELALAADARKCGVALIEDLPDAVLAKYFTPGSPS